MRILHIGKYFPPYAGGMESYLRDLMVAQARQGDQPAALVHQSDVTFSSQRGHYQANGWRLPVSRIAVWARFLFTPISPTFGWHLNRQCRDYGADVLHLHMPNVSVFWALLLPGARKIPWVVHWHADVLASSHSLGLRLFYTLYRPLEYAILKRCQAIVVSSPPYLASSIPLRDFHHKCHVIPLGLDPEKLLPLTSTHEGNNTDAPLRVLAIGRLTYYKGFEYLVRAMARTDNTELHLVGSGEQSRKLKLLSCDLGLDSRITFHGHLDDEDLARQFQLCDCLCLPSIERTEAFGVVLLEAMHYGKATIVSKVPGSGMAWVVDDGVTGLHVPPEDPDALAVAIHHLQKNRDKMRHLGASGRSKFNRNFHIDKSSAGVSALYRLILERTGTTANRPDDDNKPQH